MSSQLINSFLVIGYVASAGHGIAAAVSGNDEDLQRARRACAASTKSTLVTAGAIGGGLVGGPAGMTFQFTLISGYVTLVSSSMIRGQTQLECCRTFSNQRKFCIPSGNAI